MGGHTPHGPNNASDTRFVACPGKAEGRNEAEQPPALQPAPRHTNASDPPHGGRTVPSQVGGRPPTTSAARSLHRACRPRGQCRARTPTGPRPQHVGSGPSSRNAQTTWNGVPASEGRGHPDATVRHTQRGTRGAGWGKRERHNTRYRPEAPEPAASAAHTRTGHCTRQGSSGALRHAPTPRLGSLRASPRGKRPQPRLRIDALTGEWRNGEAGGGRGSVNPGDSATRQEVHLGGPPTRTWWGGYHLARPGGPPGPKGV